MMSHLALVLLLACTAAVEARLHDWDIDATAGATAMTGVVA